MTLTHLPEAKPDETELLQRRMLVLRLDTEAWARFEPAMVCELQRLCAACSSRQQCAHDLVTYFDDPTWPGWRDYCPNAAKLNMLSALQSFLRSGLTIDQAVEQYVDHPQAAPIERD